MKLREYLDTYGLKHVNFANKLGISRAVLSNIITGTTIPSLKLALEIEEATNGEVSCEELANFESKKIGKKKQE
jgi:DNA-binding transcriptional regulator YdaS (Cro superfamily)